VEIHRTLVVGGEKFAACRDVQLRAEWRHIRANLLDVVRTNAASGKTDLNELLQSIDDQYYEGLV